jgi:hypothetical protein
MEIKEFILEKKRHLISVGAFVAGIAVLILSGQSGPSLESYLQAETAFEKWVSSPEDAELFYNMRSALSKVPQMEPKYDGAIAQILLEHSKDQGQAEQAIALALKPLSRLYGDVPFHAAYAENSLNIERGLYQEALQKAVALKEQIEKNCDLNRFKQNPLAGGSLLYGYNLVRIACLQQRLLNRPGERAAWEEVEAFLPKAPLLAENFKEKNLDLTHYISERKKHL